MWKTDRFSIFTFLTHTYYSDFEFSCQKGQYHLQIWMDRKLNTVAMYILKGGLNSEISSLGLKSSKMGAKSLRWASSLQVDSAQGGDLAAISGDLSHIGKVSEIKPSLVKL